MADDTKRDLGESPVRKILIVDDEPTILLALSRILTTSKTEAITAGSVEDARAAMLIHAFFLVIADVRMSGMHGREGLELLGHIKEVSPETKVIIMTAFGSDEIRDDAYRLGALCYFEKPIDLVQLLSKIDSLGTALPVHEYAS